jgi:hypothetical protein
MFPPNDEAFEDLQIATAKKEKSGGWSITRTDGWSLFIDASSPVEPLPGMAARFYGDGIGRPVRGVFLDGTKIYYRTEKEQKEHEEIWSYGKDAAEWLRRWDAGESVWSIEMGGLGPGYEQCIHVTAAEILRHLLAVNYDAASWKSDVIWKRDRDAIETHGFANETVKALGLSGAQWGAAMNLAINFYRNGPRAVMTDERVKHRRIQVSRNFPGMKATS